VDGWQTDGQSYYAFILRSLCKKWVVIVGQLKCISNYQGEAALWL
jgi:hypothetical protein